MIAAVLGEKAFEIDLPDTFLVLRKADGAEQRRIGGFSAEESTVNAAQIDKIERSASHHEHRLKITAFGMLGCAVGDLGEIVQKTAATTSLT